MVPVDEEAGLNPLLTKSATELAASIRRRELSSRAVVEAHIARIVEVNPRLNAMVADRFTAARADADAADEAVRAGGDLPQFHGVPCSIKESIALAGMPLTSGLVARKAVTADGDATTVARLKRAGAIPLGVTNVSELCMWMETNNRVYGRTNNPYDPKRIVGGSSGGEGAIVGAGGTPFGLGADIGGSIRMPAFFNGVFGHKATGGLVPGTGQYPIAENQALRYLTTGPLCRRAEDLMPLLRVLAGPDGFDAGCEARTLGDPGAVRLDELHVLDVEDNGKTPVADDLRAARRRAVEALRARGARVEK
ncbi:MAG TPA: amidase, partial [Polyangia bacterium]|nr:amidase [Polyangia bacterium]